MSRYTKLLSFRILFWPLLLLPVSAQAGSWTWHTFPGLGHYENAGPWTGKPYQGSDRSEWIAAFGTSPVLSEGHDAPFMLMATDLGAVIYCSDGEHWIPADLPYTGGTAVGFDPHDGDTGYALLYKTFEQTTRNSLFRTRDRGRTWEYLTEGAYFRGQRNFIAVDPDPFRADFIYMATKSGVKRSLDDGVTWAIMPETATMEIRTLRFNSDGSSLYIVDSSINLYRADFTGSDGSYTWNQVRTQDCKDIHPHPTDPNRGIILTRTGNTHWFEDRAATNGTNINPNFFGSKEYILINPSNPDNLLAIGAGRLPLSYEWSTDGGQTWHYFQSATVNGTVYFPAITDYSPFNHGSHNWWLFDRTDTRVEGLRHLFGFWPGQPDWVVQWSTNKPKIPLLSKDQGATYKPFSYGSLFKEGTMMDIGSTDDLIVIARLEQGLVDTTNGGLWWRGSSPHNQPLFGEIQWQGNHDASWATSTMHGLAIDPENDQHWIGLYGNGPAQIIRTTDGGATWEKLFQADISLASSSQDFTRRWVYWHRQNPEIIYAGRWKSTDRGETWQILPDGFGVSEMSSENGDVLIYRSFDKYYFSRDAGETWNLIPAARGANLVLYEIPNGRHPGMVAIDPDPARDPTVEGQFLRFIVGGRDGIHEFTASNQDATAGTWNRITEGLILDDDKWVQDNMAIYFTRTVFDPRPGRHHIAYATTGLGFNGTQRLGNDKYYRPVYRSEDGGLSWTRIITDADVEAGNIPDYIAATTPMLVSRNTGKLYLNTWAGMFVYDHEATQETWYDYPVQPMNWVDTTPWLKWVNISLDPWIWSASLGKYVYLNNDSGWVYIPE